MGGVQGGLPAMVVRVSVLLFYEVAKSKKIKN